MTTYFYYLLTDGTIIRTSLALTFDGSDNTELPEGVLVWMQHSFMNTIQPGYLLVDNFLSNKDLMLAFWTRDEETTIA